MNKNTILVALTFAITAFLAISTFILSNQLKKQQALILPHPRAVETATTICGGAANTTFTGDLLYHQFTTQEECNRVAADPQHTRELVGTMAACTSGSAICVKAGSCTTGDWRSIGPPGDEFETADCTITTSIPSCSVAQFDCQTGSGWGGVVVSNCTGCGVTPTPTPTPTVTITPTPTVTSSPSPTPRATPTPNPSATPTPTPSVTSTPTPTPTTTATPTPTPPPRLGCNYNCTSDTNCVSGLVCTSGFCRNPQCTAQTSCSCQVITPTPEVPVSGSGPSVLGITAIAGGALLLLLGLAL